MAVWLLPHVGDDFGWRRFERGVVLAWMTLVAGAVAYTATLSLAGDAKYSLARQEMVRTVEARFAQRFPSSALSWVGGSWPESGALAFFGTGHPRALPGVPDDPRALVNPYPAWRDETGVLVCYAAGAYAREGAHDGECEAQARAWLQGQGLTIDEEILAYHADGWRFVRAQPKNVTVFWVPPARNRS